MIANIANIQMNTREQLIKHLEEGTKMLQIPGVKGAFEKIDRADFVDPNYREEAYEDYPLPIGFGQTISQPTTVAFVLQLLNIKPNHKILDVGSGSGYTTALLASIADKGEVLGIEIISELAEMGRENLAKYKFQNAKIECRDARAEDLNNHGNFDRILVNASAEEIPKNLIEILKPGGIMVIPIKRSVFKISSRGDRGVESAEYPGFAFVPLR